MALKDHEKRLKLLLYEKGKVVTKTIKKTLILDDRRKTVYSKDRRGLDAKQSGD